jgi:hypothetical protein
VFLKRIDAKFQDYLSDFICCLYGVPGAYGVVTLPSSVREGINIFLVSHKSSSNDMKLGTFAYLCMLCFFHVSFLVGIELRLISSRFRPSFWLFQF